MSNDKERCPRCGELGHSSCYQAARAESANLLSVIADIRHKTGVGDKPMLSELADVLAKEIERLQSRLKIRTACCESAQQRADLYAAEIERLKRVADALETGCKKYIEIFKVGEGHVIYEALAAAEKGNL